MEIIPWSDAFLVGQEPTDNEHRKLIKLANTFLGAFRDGKSQNILAVVLDELISFSREHFRREEVELRRHDRLGFIAQKDNSGWDMARITFPIWIYVSVTGVLVYLMLYQF